MIEIPLPELPLQELTLDCVDPVRGADSEGGGVRPPLAGRISLGGPHSIKISAKTAAADPDISTYIDRQSPFYEYHLIHLAISFAPRPVTPKLNSATVQLTLISVPATPTPIALSMTPLNVADQVTVQRSVKIGPDLKFVKAEYTGSSSSVYSERFLWALGVEESHPRWEFKRTARLELAGAHRLAMIVRVGAGSATTVDCLVTASTRANISRLFRRKLPDPFSLASEL